MSNALTRAQVCSVLDEMSLIANTPAQLQAMSRQMLDHDAALRQEIERLRAALESIYAFTQQNAGVVWIEEVAHQALSPKPVMESP